MDPEIVSAALPRCSQAELEWLFDRMSVGDFESVYLFCKSIMVRLTEAENKRLVSKLIRFPSASRVTRF